MWPLSRTSTREVVRIGRLAAERWVGTPKGLSLVASQPLPDDALNKPECLGLALSSLYTDKPLSRISLVLESAWSPLLLADTGGVLWGSAQVTALARHRLGSLYGRPGDDLADWEVRVDHRAGDRFALCYGVAPRVKQDLLNAAQQAGLQLDELTPAFAWGWQRLRPARQWPRQTGWWVWSEQDRRLVARVEAGRLVALNPAAPLGDASVMIEQIVNAEGIRWGLDARSGPIGVASWLPPTQLPPPLGDHMVWCALIGDVLVAQASAGSAGLDRASA